MFKKRLFAYIIDLLILNVILSFVGIFFETTSNMTNLSNELIELSNNFINGTVDSITYINRYSIINYSIEKEVFLSNLVNVIISICYFVIIPLYNNGASIGKKIMKIKIIGNDTDASANSLIIRYLLMDGIGVSIISLCLLFVLKDMNYMISVSILSFLQFIVVISSIFMVLYRRDFKSLPDLIAGTKVIEVEK